SNAIKNTPVNGKITIKLYENGDYVDFSIKDSGIGLTNEEKEKIFKKFGKIERYGESIGIDTEGSGLGLFISKEIIEMHGGKIWAESEGRNKGSIFTVRFLKTQPNNKVEEYDH
ncbi:MAG: sensor histidine kinase, partial [Promethearchaeota archaeon]